MSLRLRDSNMNHDIVHQFADTLYRRFKASAMQASLAKQDHHSKLSLNYDKQFSKGE